MTESAAVRRRRRWPWLLAAVLFAATYLWLSGGTGQHPVELTGLWRHSKNPGHRKTPLPELRLRPDGTGQFITARGGSPMTWWADGPLVVMQHDPRSVAESLHFKLGETYALLMSTGWRRPQVRLYVTSLHPDRMVFSAIEPQERTRDSTDVEELLIRVEE